MVEARDIVIFHGAGETSDSIWIPDVKRRFEQRAYPVLAPNFSDPNNPNRERWLIEALKLPFSERTVFIGHSGGCAIGLSVLETSDVPIRQAILVAGFISPNDLDKWLDEPNPLLQESYDWEKIRRNVGEVVCLNSDNDPYGCGVEKGQEIVEAIGLDKARLIVMRGQGHMGSDHFEQPYREFPYLLELVN